MLSLYLHVIYLNIEYQKILGGTFSTWALYWISQYILLPFALLMTGLYRISSQSKTYINLVSFIVERFFNYIFTFLFRLSYSKYLNFHQNLIQHSSSYPNFKHFHNNFTKLLIKKYISLLLKFLFKL